MPAIARRILEAAPPRFALIGLSMGGYIAFELLRQAPDRIARLALLDTSARPDLPEQTANRRTQIKWAEQGRFGEVVELVFPRVVHRDRRDDPRLLEIVKLMADDTGPEAFIRQQTAIIGRVDSRPGLGEIRCPTLVLVGEGDELTPPELAREIAAGIPRAQLVTIAGAGHSSTIERPAEVTRALVDALRG
jgi:pimeloyl-ACP methyl ester carboxylesterase